MKNWEKFEKELVAADGYVGIVDGKVVPCYAKDDYCERCLFNSYDEAPCGKNRVKWLYSEYKEPEPKLTAQEKAFIDKIWDGVCI